MSGRFQNPGLVEASVRPRRRRAGSSSARADKSSLVEPLPAQSAGRLLMPRRRSVAHRGRGVGDRAAEHFHHLLARFGDVDQGGPPE